MKVLDSSKLWLDGKKRKSIGRTLQIAIPTSVSENGKENKHSGEFTMDIDFENYAYMIENM